MANLQYKDFLWPNDPETYREMATREAQYTTQNGVSTYSGMGELRRVITGSGTFFGQTAYDNLKKLMDLAGQNTPGYLIHPVWGSRYGYLTGLDFQEDCDRDFLVYSFTFTEAKSDGSVPK